MSQPYSYSLSPNSSLESFARDSPPPAPQPTVSIEIIVKIDDIPPTFGVLPGFDAGVIGVGEAPAGGLMVIGDQHGNRCIVRALWESLKATKSTRQTPSQLTAVLEMKGTLEYASPQPNDGHQGRVTL